MRLSSILFTVVITITIIQMVESRGRRPKPKPKSKPKPKPWKKPAKGKGRPPWKGKKPTSINFGKYTKPGEAKCQCWWDLTRMDCGCCKDMPNVMQCGFPKHEYCYKKTAAGCPGVKNSMFTLSEQGYPCHYDHSNRTCAWCRKGAFQCGKKKHEGQQCYFKGWKTQKSCESVIPDCGHIGKDICDVNAQCVPIGRGGKEKLGGIKLPRDTTYYACQCDKDWTWKENKTPAKWLPLGLTSPGIQCADADGNLSQDPTKMVTISMTFTNEFHVYPSNSSEFPYGPSSDTLFSEMNTFIKGGANCPGCTGTLEKIP